MPWDGLPEAKSSPKRGRNGLGCAPAPGAPRNSAQTWPFPNNLRSKYELKEFSAVPDGNARRVDVVGGISLRGHFGGLPKFLALIELIGLELSFPGYSQKNSTLWNGR